MGLAIYTNIKCVLTAMRYAKFRGVKAGHSYQLELIEVLNKHPEWLEKTEPCKENDVDMLAGNMREEGKKVFNLNEYLKKQKE
jgi:hypothetical protein